MIVVCSLWNIPFPKRLWLSWSKYYNGKMPQMQQKISFVLNICNCNDLSYKGTHYGRKATRGAKLLPIFENQLYNNMGHVRKFLKRLCLQVPTILKSY